MADLQSCFFCGTPEDVQEYAVVPPRFTDDGDPRSAALCGQCKTKLLQVIEPLTERLDDGTETVESAGGTDESPTTSAAAGDDGITVSSGTETPEPSETDEGGLADMVEDDAGSRPGATPETGSDGASPPPNYRRAMRMLSNREFPLDRTEVESMLGGAYDMERHEIEAVLHHATETGDLREDGGQLYRN